MFSLAQGAQRRKVVTYRIVEPWTPCHSVEVLFLLSVQLQYITSFGWKLTHSNFSFFNRVKNKQFLWVCNYVLFFLFSYFCLWGFFFCSHNLKWLTLKYLAFMCGNHLQVTGLNLVEAITVRKSVKYWLSDSDTDYWQYYHVLTVPN